MSTKTLRKRIALVAVSALGAGLLSVVAVPSANAAVESGLNIFANTAAGGAYSLNGTSSTSQGLVATPVTGAAYNGSGTTQTAALYANGVIVVATTSATTAQKISVTGGTLATPCTNTGGGTVSSAADLTSCATTDGGTNVLFAAIKPNSGAASMVITGYDNSDATANWAVTVTVVPVGSAGTFSAGNSNIALTAAGSAPATANVDTVGANVAENGACTYLYYELKDALLLPMATTTSVIAKSPAGTTVGVGTTGTLPIATGTYGGSATYLKVCQDSLNTNKPVTGAVTLTVNGVDVATRTITIVGMAAKIAVSEDAIAKRNAAYSDAAYGSAAAGDATYVPSHSFTATDSAGNKVPTSGLTVDTTTLDAQVSGFGNIQQASPRNANAYLRAGGLSFSCADASGANAKVKVKMALPDATTLYSDAFTVTCAGAAVNYTASTDKAVYKTGDVMTVTVKGTDKSGKPANDYFEISATGDLGTIASGAIQSNVSAPADGDYFSAGSTTYKYIIGQDAGSYTVAVNFPLMNGTTYSQSAVLLPISVTSASSAVSNADVLKAIVSLIASINKQIAALQKALLKK